MILVDSSIWVDHLRHGDAALVALLEAGEVLMHPFIAGELALGRLPDPVALLRLADGLPQAVVATPAEVLGVIRRHVLGGSGIGYVDAHLLAATALTPDAALWTRDKRLLAVAGALGVAANR